MDKDYGPLKDVSAADVLTWVKAQPTGMLIGHCGAPSICLIAMYAYRVLDVDVSISPSEKPDGGGYYYTNRGATREYSLPYSLNDLACQFDALGEMDEDIYAGDPRVQRLHL